MSEGHQWGRQDTVYIKERTGKKGKARKVAICTRKSSLLDRWSKKRILRCVSNCTESTARLDGKRNLCFQISNLWMRIHRAATTWRRRDLWLVAVAMDTKHHNCEHSSACREQSSKRKLKRGKDKGEGKRIKYLSQFILSLSLSVSVSVTWKVFH